MHATHKVVVRPTHAMHESVVVYVCIIMLDHGRLWREDGSKSYLFRGWVASSWIVC
jgi:hypothetical protein